MTHTPAARISMMLTLIALVVPATTLLRADEDQWDEHMKAGFKAYESGCKEKYFWPEPTRSTPATVREFAKAEGEFLAALAQIQTFPAGDLRTAKTLGALADVYMEEGKYADAEDRGNKAIAILEKSAGPDDSRLGKDLARLATIYDYDSKPEQAAPLWDRSLAILKMTGGADPEFLSIVKFRASVLSMQPAIDVQIYKYILDLSESAGASDKDLKASLLKLAINQHGSDAEQTYTRILEIDKKMYGPDNMNTMIDLDSFARVCVEEGKYAAALPLLQHVREVRQKDGLAFELEWAKTSFQGTLLQFHVEKEAESSQKAALVRVDKELAQAYTGTGKYSEAEELLKQIVSMDEAGAQPSRDLDERDMSDELIGLSAVYRHERRYDDALETMKRCESIDDEIANSKFEKANAKPNTPSIYFWLSQIELAEVYRERGETAAAEPVFQRSVEMAQNLRLVPGHPKLAQLYDNYATLIRDEGKYGEAEALYKRALDTWAKSRYPDHPDVAGTLTDYAALLRKGGRPAEAEPLEARAREVVAKASVPASVN